jgi:hypothetical protein
MRRNSLLIVLLLIASFVRAQEVPPPPPADAPPAVAPDREPPPAAPAPFSPADLNGLDAAGGLRGPGGFGGFPGGNLTPGANYRATWFPVQPVAGQNTHLGFVEQNLSLSSPLWTDASSAILANVGVRSDLFQTHAILPDSHQGFPAELWNVHLGLSGYYRFDNGWTAGGGVHFGSASDHPFSTFNTLNVGVNSFLRVPWGEHDAWLFSLAYSPLGQLPFPIPGVAYSWNPSPSFSANLGVPLGVVYRPSSEWTLEATYMLLTRVHARATYRPCAGLSFYGGYDWTNYGWFLSNEARTLQGSSDQTPNRFLYYEQRLTCGVRYRLTPSWTFDFSGGYAFDRYYTQGNLLRSSGDHLNIGDGPFLSGQVHFRW